MVHVVSVFLVLCSATQGLAFNRPVSRLERGSKVFATSDALTGKVSGEDSRRSFFVQAAAVTLAVGSGSFSTVAPARASGGATAGGVYLLSAKQRYNERVKAAVQGFLSLESSLKADSVAEAQKYFASEEVGTWGDVSTAGYLLANAFRRNSAASPDSLPSVKKWKGFVKELDGMQKAVKKNKAADALASFQSATAALDEYLTQVELPSVAELRR